MHGISNNYRTGVYDGKIAGLYDLEETLGSGHFAVVKLARHVFTGEKVAVKVIDKTKLDEVSTAHLFQEVRCMKLVQHPNVVRLYEVIDTQTKLYLILELGDGGDLYDYIMKHEGGLSENLAREYFRQIVRAISYCHQLHVVHRDLKPENVVFFEKLGIVKLTDFGFSNKFCPGQKLETSCGSLAYSAPEILLGDSYDAPAVDVWSLGVILYMLVCGQPPFQEANDSETLIMIMDCKYSMPAHVSPGCRKLIGMMLVREPEKRATLQVIAEDVWLQEDETKTKTNITSTKIADQLPEYLPLVSREQVSEEDHSLIIQKMVNGNIATKEEILDALDRNEYNHITATYFLLAERKLRAHRQEQLQKQGPDLVLPVATNRNSPRFRTQGVKREATTETEDNHLLAPIIKPIHLNLPRTPGTDGGGQSGRARKCSIVQEEDDEDEISSCSGREELQPPINRRGSRSEGRLNIAIQDRIAEAADRLKKETTSTTTILPKTSGGIDSISGVTLITDNNSDTIERLGVAGSGLIRRPGDFRPRTAETSKLFSRWKQQGQNDINSELINDNNENKLLSTIRANSIDSNYLLKNMVNDNNTDIIATKILTDSSTITIPLKQNQNIIITPPMPKYKTMPSPTRPNSILSTNNCLNEIYEEATDVGSSDTSTTTTPRPIVRHTQISSNLPQSHSAERTTTGTSTSSATTQRRTKFHKTRTASCSSSDASDDDSENRKKRAHKIVDTTKPTPQRRDSHDDSSDSQDPGNTPASGGSSNNTSHFVHINVTQPANNQNSSNRTSSNSTTGRQQKILTSSSLSSATTTTTTTNTAQQLAYRRHRNGRRRAGETRLRESQSLNRITEVQELESVVQLNSVIQNHISISTMVSTTTTTTTTHHHQHDSPNIIENTNIGIVENNNHNCHNINNNNNNSNNNTNNNLDILCNNSSSTMPLSGNNKTSKTQTNKPKGFSARLLQSFKKADTYIFQSTSDNDYSASNSIAAITKNGNNSLTQHNHNNNNNNNNNTKLMHECTGEEIYDEDHPARYTEMPTSKTKINENNKTTTSSSATKKLKMLGRYFQVHKKICIPLPGIFQRGRLYKAQSCGSIVRDKITHLPVNNNNIQQQQTTTHPRTTDTTSTTINYRHSSALFSDKNRILRNCIGSRLLGSDSDINQNNDNILIDNKKSSIIFTLPINKHNHHHQQQQQEQHNDIENFLNEKYTPITTLQQQQQHNNHHQINYTNNHIKQQTTIINSNNNNNCGGNNDSVQVFSSKC